MDRWIYLNFMELPGTLFERLFTKLDNPVILCTNCLCQYCANNEEELWHKVKPGKMKEPCFNCDECRMYNGDYRFRDQNKEDCMDFIMSDYGAEKRKKGIKLVKSGR